MAAQEGVEGAQAAETDENKQLLTFSNTSVFLKLIILDDADIFRKLQGQDEIDLKMFICSRRGDTEETIDDTIRFNVKSSPDFRGLILSQEIALKQKNGVFVFSKPGILSRLASSFTSLFTGESDPLEGVPIKVEMKVECHGIKIPFGRIRERCHLLNVVPAFKAEFEPALFAMLTGKYIDWEMLYKEKALDDQWWDNTPIYTLLNRCSHQGLQQLQENHCDSMIKFLSWVPQQQYILSYVEKVSDIYAFQIFQIASKVLEQSGMLRIKKMNQSLQPHLKLLNESNILTTKVLSFFVRSSIEEGIIGYSFLRPSEMVPLTEVTHLKTNEKFKKQASIEVCENDLETMLKTLNYDTPCLFYTILDLLKNQEALLKFPIDASIEFAKLLKTDYDFMKPSFFDWITFLAKRDEVSLSIEIWITEAENRDKMMSTLLLALVPRIWDTEWLRIAHLISKMLFETGGFNETNVDLIARRNFQLRNNEILLGQENQFWLRIYIQCDKSVFQEERYFSILIQNLAKILNKVSIKVLANDPGVLRNLVAYTRVVENEVWVAFANEICSCLEQLSFQRQANLDDWKKHESRLYIMCRTKKLNLDFKFTKGVVKEYHIFNQMQTAFRGCLKQVTLSNALLAYRLDREYFPRLESRIKFGDLFDAPDCAQWIEFTNKLEVIKSFSGLVKRLNTSNFKNSAVIQCIEPQLESTITVQDLFDVPLEELEATLQQRLECRPWGVALVAKWNKNPPSDPIFDKALSSYGESISAGFELFFQNKTEASYIVDSALGFLDDSIPGQQLCEELGLFSMFSHSLEATMQRMTLLRWNGDQGSICLDCLYQLLSAVLPESAMCQVEFLKTDPKRVLIIFEMLFSEDQPEGASALLTHRLKNLVGYQVAIRNFLKQLLDLQDSSLESKIGAMIQSSSSRPELRESLRLLNMLYSYTRKLSRNKGNIAGVIEGILVFSRCPLFSGSQVTASLRSACSILNFVATTDCKESFSTEIATELLDDHTVVSLVKHANIWRVEITREMDAKVSWGGSLESLPGVKCRSYGCTIELKIADVCLDLCMLHLEMANVSPKALRLLEVLKEVAEEMTQIGSMYPGLDIFRNWQGNKTLLSSVIADSKAYEQLETILENIGDKAQDIEVEFGSHDNLLLHYIGGIAEDEEIQNLHHKALSLLVQYRGFPLCSDAVKTKFRRVLTTRSAWYQCLSAFTYQTSQEPVPLLFSNDKYTGSPPEDSNRVFAVLCNHELQYPQLNLFACAVDYLCECSYSTTIPLGNLMVASDSTSLLYSMKTMKQLCRYVGGPLILVGPNEYCSALRDTVFETLARFAELPLTDPIFVLLEKSQAESFFLGLQGIQKVTCITACEMLQRRSAEEWNAVSYPPLTNLKRIFNYSRDKTMNHYTYEVSLSRSSTVVSLEATLGGLLIALSKTDREIILIIRSLSNNIPIPVLATLHAFLTTRYINRDMAPLSASFEHLTIISDSSVNFAGYLSNSASANLDLKILAPRALPSLKSLLDQASVEEADVIRCLCHDLKGDVNNFKNQKLLPFRYTHDCLKILVTLLKFMTAPRQSHESLAPFILEGSTGTGKTYVMQKAVELVQILHGEEIIHIHIVLNDTLSPEKLQEHIYKQMKQIGNQRRTQYVILDEINSVRDIESIYYLMFRRVYSLLGWRIQNVSPCIMFLGTCNPQSTNYFVQQLPSYFLPAIHKMPDLTDAVTMQFLEQKTSVAFTTSILALQALCSRHGCSTPSLRDADRCLKLKSKAEQFLNCVGLTSSSLVQAEWISLYFCYCLCIVNRKEGWLIIASNYGCEVPQLLNFIERVYERLLHLLVDDQSSVFPSSAVKDNLFAILFGSFASQPVLLLADDSMSKSLCIKLVESFIKDRSLTTDFRPHFENTMCLRAQFSGGMHMEDMGLFIELVRKYFDFTYSLTETNVVQNKSFEGYGNIFVALEELSLTGRYAHEIQRSLHQLLDLNQLTSRSNIQKGLRVVATCNYLNERVPMKVFDLSLLSRFVLVQHSPLSSETKLEIIKAASKISDVNLLLERYIPANGLRSLIAAADLLQEHQLVCESLLFNSDESVEGEDLKSHLALFYEKFTNRFATSLAYTYVSIAEGVEIHLMLQQTCPRPIKVIYSQHDDYKNLAQVQYGLETGELVLVVNPSIHLLDSLHSVLNVDYTVDLNEPFAAALSLGIFTSYCKVLPQSKLFFLFHRPTMPKLSLALKSRLGFVNRISSSELEKVVPEEYISLCMEETTITYGSHDDKQTVLQKCDRPFNFIVQTRMTIDNKSKWLTEEEISDIIQDISSRNEKEIVCFGMTPVQFQGLLFRLMDDDLSLDLKIVLIIPVALKELACTCSSPRKDVKIIWPLDFCTVEKMKTFVDQLNIASEVDTVTKNHIDEYLRYAKSEPIKERLMRELQPLKTRLEIIHSCLKKIPTQSLFFEEYSSSLKEFLQSRFGYAVKATPTTVCSFVNFDAMIRSFWSSSFAESKERLAISSTFLDPISQLVPYFSIVFATNTSALEKVLELTSDWYVNLDTRNRCMLRALWHWTTFRCSLDIFPEPVLDFLVQHSLQFDILEAIGSFHRERLVMETICRLVHLVEIDPKYRNISQVVNSLFESSRNVDITLVSECVRLLGTKLQSHCCVLVSYECLTSGKTTTDSLHRTYALISSNKEGKNFNGFSREALSLFASHLMRNKEDLLVAQVLAHLLQHDLERTKLLMLDWLSKIDVAWLAKCARYFECQPFLGILCVALETVNHSLESLFKSKELIISPKAIAVYCILLKSYLNKHDISQTAALLGILNRRIDKLATPLNHFILRAAVEKFNERDFSRCAACLQHVLPMEMHHYFNETASCVTNQFCPLSVAVQDAWPEAEIPTTVIGVITMVKKCALNDDTTVTLHSQNFALAGFGQLWMCLNPLKELSNSILPGITDLNARKLVHLAGGTSLNICKCGYQYAIGDCGQAMISAKCPECHLMIGGQMHTLNVGQEGVMEDSVTAGFPEEDCKQLQVNYTNRKISPVCFRIIMVLLGICMMKVDTVNHYANQLAELLGASVADVDIVLTHLLVKNLAVVLEAMLKIKSKNSLSVGKHLANRDQIEVELQFIFRPVEDDFDSILSHLKCKMDQEIRRLFSLYPLRTSTIEDLPDEEKNSQFLWQYLKPQRRVKFIDRSPRFKQYSQVVESLQAMLVLARVLVQLTLGRSGTLHRNNLDVSLKSIEEREELISSWNYFSNMRSNFECQAFTVDPISEATPLIHVLIDGKESFAYQVISIGIGEFNRLVNNEKRLEVDLVGLVHYKGVQNAISCLQWLLETEDKDVISTIKNAISRLDTIALNMDSMEFKWVDDVKTIEFIKSASLERFTVRLSVEEKKDLKEYLTRLSVFELESIKNNMESIVMALNAQQGSPKFSQVFEKDLFTEWIIPVTDISIRPERVVPIGALAHVSQIINLV